MTGPVTIAIGDDPISLDGLHAGEIKAIREACLRGLRNAEIRQRYAELLPRIGQIQAIEQIADEYTLSPTQVRNILYVRRDAA